MQRPDEHKRAAILEAAARLFATRDFHLVRLDDIASAAQVGKGTLYVYFESKETLYLSLVRDGFSRLVESLRQELSTAPVATKERLRIIADGLIDFAHSLPDLYRVMRTRILTPEDPELLTARSSLSRLIESVLKDGIGRGEVEDAHPEMTTQFILSFVRGVMLYPPENLNREALRDQLLKVLWGGIGVRRRRSVRKKAAAS